MDRQKGTEGCHQIPENVEVAFELEITRAWKSVRRRTSKGGKRNAIVSDDAGEAQRRVKRDFPTGEEDGLGRKSLSEVTT